MNNLSANKIISFQIGADYFMKSNVNYKFFKINNFGQAYGIIIPINIPSVQTSVKAKYAWHSLKKSELYDSQFFYASLLNEILIGKRFLYSNSLSVLPQFGLGIKNDLIASSEKPGYKNYIGRYYGFYDLSVSCTYKYDHFDLGVLVNFEKGFTMDINTNNVINFSIILMI